MPEPHPHGRGLGSSSAAIVGGIVAARALTVGGDERLDDERLLALATEMEGHPTTSRRQCTAASRSRGPTAEKSACCRWRPTSISLRWFSSRAPNFERPKHARHCPTMPHAEAADNAARAAILVEAMTRRPDLLLTATEDLLHQEYRRSVMPRSLALVDELRALGYLRSSQGLVQQCWPSPTR